MRITTLFTLKHNSNAKKRIKESLMIDIQTIAEARFDNNQFFKIDFKLTPIEKYNGYK